MNLKEKCKCGHKKEVHGDPNYYEGECCVIYKKDDKLKCCPCLKFNKNTSPKITGGSGPRKKITGTGQQGERATRNGANQKDSSLDASQLTSNKRSMGNPVDNHTSKVKSTNINQTGGKNED